MQTQKSVPHVSRLWNIRGHLASFSKVLAFLYIQFSLPLSTRQPCIHISIKSLSLTRQGRGAAPFSITKNPSTSTRASP